MGCGPLITRLSVTFLNIRVLGEGQAPTSEHVLHRGPDIRLVPVPLAQSEEYYGQLELYIWVRSANEFARNHEGSPEDGLDRHVEGSLPRLKPAEAFVETLSGINFAESGHKGVET